MSRTQAHRADVTAPSPPLQGRSAAPAPIQPVPPRADGFGAPATGPEDGRDVVVPPSLYDAVAYALRVAQESSFDSYLRRVGNPDLKPGRYSALSVLAANPGLSPTALSRVLGRDKSTVTATLRDLRSHGLVMRTDRPGDRRSYGVALTPDGVALLDRLRDHARRHDAMLDAIVGADKPVLMNILRGIVRGLAEAEARSGFTSGPRREG